MAETNATPTVSEVKLVRSDIDRFVPEGRTVTSYITQALAQFKRDLVNKRSISFSTVFDTTNDLYFLNSDSEDWNDTNCIHILSILTASLLASALIQPSDMPHTSISLSGAPMWGKMMWAKLFQAAWGQVCKPRPRAATMMFCKNMP